MPISDHQCQSEAISVPIRVPTRVPIRGLQSANLIDTALGLCLLLTEPLSALARRAASSLSC